MLPTWRDARQQREIRSARLQEAERWRLIRTAEMGMPAQAPIFERIMVWLGEGLESLGRRLQERYESSAAIETAHACALEAGR